MKIETILNALMFTRVESSLAFRGYVDMDIEQAKRRSRQVHSFRDRIIRMDERNKMRIAKLEDRCFYLKREIEERERMWERDR